MRESLFEFINQSAPDTDIFCFQEIYVPFDETGIWVGQSVAEKLSVFKAIQELLPDHIGVVEDPTAPKMGTRKGLATFVKKNIALDSYGEFMICNPAKIISPKKVLTYGNLQYLEITEADDKYLIANIHGLFSEPKGDKLDNPDRLQQSRRIKEFLDNNSKLKVVVGDFNLWPETESIKIIETGMRNLIKENNITSTRSSYFKFSNKYSNYVFVSPEINVLDFKVIETEVSDHLPLLLEFE